MMIIENTSEALTYKPMIYKYLFYCMTTVLTTVWKLYTHVPSF